VFAITSRVSPALAKVVRKPPVACQELRYLDLLLPLHGGAASLLTPSSAWLFTR